MLARSPNSIPAKIKQKRHRHKPTPNEPQQTARPRMPHPIVHWPRQEHECGTAQATKESITCQDRSRMIRIRVWEVIQD